MLAVAAAGGALGLLLRQPLIVAFIAVGIALGPSVTGLVTAADQLDLLAKLGITLLLFVVGLRLDIQLIRTMGPVALATGLGQVIFTAVVGYFIALGFGFSSIAAVYIAVALTFSSTIIIVKLLSDKREIDSLHGRIAVGFLIVQDIVVVLAMIALAALGADTGAGPVWQQMLGVVLKGVAFLAVIALAMRYVLNGLVHRLARIPELLILFAIAWAVSLAAVGEVLGFSKEVGAFLGGVSLASTPVRDLMAARLVTLRDFLLLFFFIDLGAQLDLGMIGAELDAAVAFSVFVLVGNPLIVVAIMAYMGYRPRTGFLAGLTVAQVSEFSLILVALGATLGHVGQEVVGLTTLVALITISASTYMILYSHQLYGWLAPALQIFERPGIVDREAAFSEPDSGQPAEVVVFGAGRFGAAALRELTQQGVGVLAVDFDPEAVRSIRELHIPVQYGDAGDPEFLAGLPLHQVRWVISSVRDPQSNHTLLAGLREHGFGGRIAVVAHSEHEARALADNGVDDIIRPYRDAARDVVQRLVPDATSRPATEERGVS
ncbi:cation:proton antiporter [Ectothiorhodospiraceae bacterium WFHF3C12]|nr:cation:proton antiporter [Ectothiorhodospiraceae bacterium WFHF3C12]